MTYSTNGPIRRYYNNKGSVKKQTYQKIPDPSLDRGYSCGSDPVLCCTEMVFGDSDPRC